MTEFKLPELGENIEQGDLVRLMIAPGADVKEGQPVMELETDKAVIEVPSSVSGVVHEIRVKEGDKLKVGQVIFTVENGAGAKAQAPQAQPPQAQPSEAQPPKSSASAPVQSEPAAAPPAEKSSAPIAASATRSTPGACNSSCLNSARTSITSGSLMVPWRLRQHGNEHESAGGGGTPCSMRRVVERFLIQQQGEVAASPEAAPQWVCEAS